MILDIFLHERMIKNYSTGPFFFRILYKTLVKEIFTIHPLFWYI